MPALTPAGDVDLFDFTEALVITQDGVNQTPTALRRPMSHSGARALQQFVTFTENDEVFHINASELTDPLAFNDSAIIHDQYGQRYTVTMFELQTAMMRLVVVARRANDPDLVIWLPLDENDGTLAHDRNGVANGTLISLDFGDDSVPGAVQTGLQIPTSSDYVHLGFPAALDDVAPISFSLWCKLVSPTAVTRKLVEWGYLEIALDSEALTVFQNFSTNAGQWGNATTRSMDQWMHLVVTYDRALTTDDPLAYLDGQSVPLTETQTPAGTISSDVSIVKRFGASVSDPRLQLDDIRVYNRKLTALEIESLYLLGTP